MGAYNRREISERLTGYQTYQKSGGILSLYKNTPRYLIEFIWAVFFFIQTKLLDVLNVSPTGSRFGGVFLNFCLYTV